MYVIKIQHVEEKINFTLSGEAETGSAEEQPARISLMDGDDMEGAGNAPSTPNLKSSLSLIPKKTYQNMKCNKKILKIVWNYHRNRNGIMVEKNQGTPNVPKSRRDGILVIIK